ncbi:hypothetical protein HBN76_14480 [Pseudomonas sp. WS 5013]|uniref:hypothetical protein n=1 Tax=Pseudomonas sp. WS 5013 TaxID=2717475 RepID=UPI001472C316|nr:hypothetical protein [Pseudomonas sp. WS 5013]NMY42525.1 hypothetical protein [Pseudomonas sp. WS 5013]
MKDFVKQLDELLAKYADMRGKSKHNDLSDFPKVERQSIVTRSIAAVHRATGSNSTYSLQINKILEKWPELHLHTSSIIGVVQAARDDLSAGYINTLIELVHAETFSDFLDMASHLQEAGYKDAAAVITGSTLESHIRGLCYKHGIDIEINGQPAKADRLNSELTKAEAYSKLDNKNVTAWLDLRNKAAHGKYTEYTKEQVDLLIASVRDFIARTPA